MWDRDRCSGKTDAPQTASKTGMLDVMQNRAGMEGIEMLGGVEFKYKVTFGGRAGIAVAAALVVWLVGWAGARADAPRAVATFHSLGLYWSPAGGGPDHQVFVRYREEGTDRWFEGLPMRYNPIDGTDEDLADYRGSLVHLRPGATYEVELSLDDGSETASLTTSTWSEDVPVARTVQVPSGSDQFDITESGSPDGYVLYDGTGSTLDGGDVAEYNITVDASYVIIRGFTLRGAVRDGIRIFHGNDIIIEDCDISGWGRLDFDGDYGQNMDAAVFFSDPEVTRVVVQRCAMHNPRYDANSWAEYNCHSQSSCSNHPAGPQAIVCYNSAGNHVFRYNKVWSDADHYFNDIFGGGSNGSYEGFPGPDSDIYGNDLANCWDDGIEAEGGGRNVRIWANHVNETFMAYANAPVSIGPWYFWRNVSGRSYSPDDSQYGTYAHFLKMGYADSVDWMTGHMYVFHNTIWNQDDQGCDGLGGSGRWIKHCVSRNNVLHIRSDASNSISTRAENVDNDYDYDLYNGEVPDGSEPHGISGVPTYAATGYDPNTSSGDFQLAAGSDGYDAATPLPNFDDYYLDAAPDMGAQETGTDPMVFGLEAGMGPVIQTASLPDAWVGQDYEFQLTASGGRKPILWTVIAGGLPDGLTLDRDGRLHGSPTEPGSFSIVVYARDADSLLDRADLSLDVLGAVDCVEPLVACGSECVDLSGDSANCGECFHACGEGSTCVAGECSGSGGDGGPMDGAVGDAGIPGDGGQASSVPSGCGCFAASGSGPEGQLPFWILATLLGLFVVRRQSQNPPRR